MPGCVTDSMGEIAEEDLTRRIAGPCERIAENVRGAEKLTRLGFLNKAVLLKLENLFFFRLRDLIELGDLRISQLLDRVECLALFVIADELFFGDFL